MFGLKPKEAKKRAPYTTEERDADVVPLAREIIKRLAKYDDIPIGTVAGSEGAEETARWNQKFYQEELIPLLLERNIRLGDLTYTFVLATTALQNILDITKASLDMNKDITEAKMWGVDELNDLRVGDLDSAMKELDAREDGDNASAKTQGEV